MKLLRHDLLGNRNSDGLGERRVPALPPAAAATALHLERKIETATHPPPVHVSLVTVRAVTDGWSLCCPTVILCSAIALLVLQSVRKQASHNQHGGNLRARDNSTTNSSNVETARTTFQLKSQGPRCRQAGKRAGARPPVRAIRLQPERPSRDIWATSGRSMAPVASAGARDDEHQGSNNDCSEAVVNEATEATTTATVEGGSTGSHPSGVAGLIVTLSSTIDDNLRLFR